MNVLHDVNEKWYIGAVATVIFGIGGFCGYNTIQNENIDPGEKPRTSQVWDENKPLVLQPVKPQPVAKNTLDLIPR